MNRFLLKTRYHPRFSAAYQYGSRLRIHPIFTSKQHCLLGTALRASNRGGNSVLDTPARKAGPVLVLEENRKADLTQTGYCIVNLYHLVDIPDPYHVVELHKGWMTGHDIKGRIYFSCQGVNAQFTGPVLETEQYLQWMKLQPWFQGLNWNSDPVGEHMFPKLRLKVKPNLVQLHGGITELPITHPASRATPLNPTEWKSKFLEALKTQDPNEKAVILDVRNGYEWDAGHFQGAVRPQEDSFAETPVTSDIPDPLKSANKHTPVFMYCTGGIRCDIYSTILKKRGFTHLYSLEGGVQRYFKEEGDALWDGSLFVFDGRMAISAEGFDGSQQELQSSISCQICGGEGQVPHVNCANVDCNRLFVGCVACKAQYKGCCCVECMDAPRLLRPSKVDGGYYGKFGTYAMGRLQKSMREGGQRHEAKRQRRLVRLRSKRAANKALKSKAKKVVHAKAEESSSELSRPSITTALNDFSLMTH